jgi:hypothetical protein
MIVAVPLLYLLTLPAVMAVAVPIGSSAPHPSKWLEVYFTPASWLYNFEPFAKVYAPYCEWCWKTVLRRTDLL